MVRSRLRALWRPRRLPGRIVLLAVGVLTLAAQTAPVAGYEIESLRLLDVDGGVELQAESSGNLRLVGVQVQPDGTLVVQLPRHRRGPAVRDLFPQAGLVREVLLTTEETSRGALTRVRIGTRGEVSHTLATEDRLLRLRMWPRGAESLEASRAAELRRQVEEVRAALAESERARGVLDRRAKILERENEALVGRFEAMESRRSELDSTMKTALGEASALLAELADQGGLLKAELRQAASREQSLRRRLGEMEAELAESAGGRQELAAELQAARAEGLELARQADLHQAREAELEVSLAAGRQKIDELERERSVLAEHLDQRLQVAASREDELRAQLGQLETTIADLRAAGAASGDEVDAVGTFTRVDGGDGYRGWVSDPEDEDPEVTALRAALSSARDELVRMSESSHEAESELAARLEQLGEEKRQLAERLAAADSAAAESRSAAEAEREKTREVESELAARLEQLSEEKRQLAERLAAAESAAAESAAARGRAGSAPAPATRAEVAAEAAELIVESPADAVAVAGEPEATTTGELYLRRGPRASTEAILVLKNGGRVRVLARRAYWLRVRLPSGAEGWVSGRYLRLEEEGPELEAAVADALRAARAPKAALEPASSAPAPIARGRAERDINLYRGPGTEYVPAAVVKGGTSLQVLEKAGDWLRVRGGGAEGWIRAQEVSLVEIASVGG